MFSMIWEVALLVAKSSSFIATLRNRRSLLVGVGLWIQGDRKLWSIFWRIVAGCQEDQRQLARKGTGVPAGKCASCARGYATSLSSESGRNPTALSHHCRAIPWTPHFDVLSYLCRSVCVYELSTR